MKQRIPRLWRSFELISAEASSGWRCTHSARSEKKWKLILSDFRFLVVPRLAADSLNFAGEEFWEDVGPCLSWLYCALERPQRCPTPDELSAWRRILPVLVAIPSPVGKLRESAQPRQLASAVLPAFGDIIKGGASAPPAAENPEHFHPHLQIREPHSLIDEDEKGLHIVETLGAHRK